MQGSSEEIVLPDGLGLNRCSNNRSKPPPPIPDRAFRCVSRVGLGIFIFYEAIRCYRCDRWKADSDLAEAKSENNEGFRCQTLLGGFSFDVGRGRAMTPGEARP